MSSQFWSEHVFVLVTPDTLARGLAPRLVARLRRDGFDPVTARIVQANSDMVDELYADVQAGQLQTWRYRLIDNLFSIGPCLALACRYEGSEPEPHAALRERKGHQHPDQQRPGTIRFDFAAINSILGVMHASDNPKESQKDASVFGIDEDDVLAELAGGAVPAEQVDLLAEMTVPHSPQPRGYAAVIADVRARVLLAMWPTMSASTRKMLTTELAGVAALASPQLPQRLAALLEALPATELGPAAIEVLTCPFNPQWRAARGVTSVFNALRQVGVGLDRWEHLVLETSLYFPATLRPPTDLR